MQAGRLVCSAFVKAQNQDHQDRGLTRTHVNRPSAAMAFNQLPNGTLPISWGCVIPGNPVILLSLVSQTKYHGYQGER